MQKNMKKEKFEQKTKKGQTVYYIQVNIRSTDSKYNSSGVYLEGIFIEELKIVHQTNKKIALSDEYITTLDRKNEGEKHESYKHYLEDISVNIVTKETFFPNGIFTHCYSLENPEKCIAKMKHKIINKINADYGFLRFANVEEIIEGFKITNI